LGSEEAAVSVDMLIVGDIDKEYMLDDGFVSFC
jgi:hypothetical protein